jgi:hypothetical protein
MRDGVQSLGGKLPWRHLVGLEHRLKDEDRVKARIAEDMRVKGRAVSEAFATLGDAVRFAFQYPEDRYTEGVYGDLRQLAAEGFTEVRRVNFWTRPAEHKGIRQTGEAGPNHYEHPPCRLGRLMLVLTSPGSGRADQPVIARCLA